MNSVASYPETNSVRVGIYVEIVDSIIFQGQSTYWDTLILYSKKFFPEIRKFFGF